MVREHTVSTPNACDIRCHYLTTTTLFRAMKQCNTISSIIPLPLSNVSCSRLLRLDYTFETEKRKDICALERWTTKMERFTLTMRKSSKLYDSYTSLKNRARRFVRACEQHSFYIDAEVVSRVNKETRVTSSLTPLSRDEFQRSRLQRGYPLGKNSALHVHPMQIRLYQLPVNNKVVEESEEMVSTDRETTKSIEIPFT